MTHLCKPNTPPPFSTLERAPKWRTGFISASLSVLLSGCISLSPDTPKVGVIQPEPGEIVCGKPQAPNPATSTQSQPESTPAKAPEADLWVRLRQQFRLWDVSHPRIQREIARLQHHPQSFQVLISRAEPFLAYIAQAVEQRGLPGELALLPAVESGFRPFAYSPSGAAGLWQMMPGTGRMLGLQQDWWHDQRRDPVAATEAALNYLERLNQRFDGDWLHALAAYNAGGGTVSRALRKAKAKGGHRDFWHLDLPGETDAYVPRLLALAEVVSDPGRYGLALPSVPDTPYFVSIDTQGPIDLKVAARLAAMPVDELLQLNPAFNRWSTSPDGPHRLLLPVDRSQAFQEGLAALPDNERLRWTSHRIAKGEVLGSIARQHGVSVKAIMQANKLHNSRIRAGKTLMIPLSGSANLASLPRDLGLPKTRVRYRVRKGDSLYKIAKRFRVRIKDLRRWNRVGRYIKPGQRLIVYVDPIRQTAQR